MKKKSIILVFVLRIDWEKESINAQERAEKTPQMATDVEHNFLLDEDEKSTQLSVASMSLAEEEEEEKKQLIQQRADMSNQIEIE